MQSIQGVTGCWSCLTLEPVQGQKNLNHNGQIVGGSVWTSLSVTLHGDPGMMDPHNTIIFTSRAQQGFYKKKVSKKKIPKTCSRVKEKQSFEIGQRPLSLSRSVFREMIIIITQKLVAFLNTVNDQVELEYKNTSFTH